MSIFGRRNNVITYTVNKAINRDMYITVQNGEVVVNAPWYFSSNKIQTLVEEKKNWILSKLKENEENLTNIQYVKIFGRYYDIKVSYKNIKTPELNLEENSEIKIILPIKYKKIGNEQIAINELEDIMEKVRIMLGIAPEEYRIENTEKTLGKCVDKIITINPNLMQFKKETIEYVIIHEFCHLKYKSHCKKFYEMIDKNIKDYKKYEKELEGYQY